jgi:hypothetical protein
MTFSWSTATCRLRKVRHPSYHATVGQIICHRSTRADLPCVPIQLLYASAIYQGEWVNFCEVSFLIDSWDLVKSKGDLNLLSYDTLAQDAFKRKADQIEAVWDWVL